MPLVAVFSLLLLALNPWLNPGPLFYVQIRMGRNCNAFRAYKFRTMLPAGSIKRSPTDPLELHRITWLGALVRKARIDELPQALNVIRGDMSLIGPRPDYFHHARHYLRNVADYRDRHAIRPGITGLAQVDLGYVSSLEGTARKVEQDLHYIENAGFLLDTRIALKTLVTVFSFCGT
jgi:lipopolysaccharide/colanic/teichoic acid biosynthesis glycosyltransferase